MSRFQLGDFLVCHICLWSKSRLLDCWMLLQQKLERSARGRGWKEATQICHSFQVRGRRITTQLNSSASIRSQNLVSCYMCKSYMKYGGGNGNSQSAAGECHSSSPAIMEQLCFQLRCTQPKDSANVYRNKIVKVRAGKKRKGFPEGIGK